MNPILSGSIYSIAFFAGLLVAIEVGRRLRLWRRSHGNDVSQGLGTIEGAMFGLMALIVAFAFNGAASRFDFRRELIVKEVTAIGTAYQRIDLLAAEDRLALQQKFKEYVDARIALYKVRPGTQEAIVRHAKAVAIGNDVWTQAATAVASAPNPTVAALLLSAINSMIDIATERAAAALIHPPRVVYLMLGGIAILAAMFAGYAMGAGEGRSWLHIIGFAAVLAITTYVIIDLEHPRLGHFRMTGFDQLLIDWRAGI